MPNSGKHNVNNIDSFFKVRPSRTTIREGETISFLEKGKLVKQEKRNGVVYETIYVEQGTQEVKSTTTTTSTSTATGDISSVTAGTGLSGGGVSGPVTLNIDSTVVTLTGTQTLTNKTLTAPTFTGTAQGASLTLTGDLTVQGDTTTLNTATLQVEDKNIVLNYHASNDTSSSAEGAGITIQDAVDASTDATILWDATNDEFDFSHTVTAPDFTGNLTGNVTGSASLNLLKSNNLSDLTNAATARTNLGVDAAGTDNSTDVTIAAGKDYITINESTQVITLGSVDLTTDVTGVLPSANLDADTAHLSGTQTFTGAKTFNSLTSFTMDGNTISGIDDSSEFTNNDSHIMTSAAVEDKILSYGYITEVGIDAIPASDIIDSTEAFSDSDDLLMTAAAINDRIESFGYGTGTMSSWTLTGDSGTNQSITNSNIVDIAGGTGISTTVSATDTLTVNMAKPSTELEEPMASGDSFLIFDGTSPKFISPSNAGGSLSLSDLSGGLAASKITSGTIADARIAASSITQHTDPKYLRSNAADTATGLLTLNGGVHILSGTGGGKLRIKRNSGSTDGDDIVDLHMDDGGLYFDNDNDNDADSGNFTFRYKTGGSFTNLLAMTNSGISYKGNTIPTISNMANDRIVTGNSSTTIRGESNVTINSSNNLTIGGGGQLTLTGGTNAVINVNSTADSFIEKDSGTNLYIANNVSNQDIYFRINDGGTNKTAIRIDASEIGNVLLPNWNQALKIGASGNLYAYHSSTEAHIVNNTGNLLITNNQDDGDIIFRTDNGSGGVTNYLQIDGGAENIYVYKDLRLAATKKLYLDGGSNTYISETSADNLKFYVGGVNLLSMIEGGTNVVKVGDGTYLGVGDSTDFYMHHSTNSFMTNGTGRLEIRNQAQDQDIRFSVNDGGSTSNILTLNAASSRVGIGTTSPGRTLQVNGDGVARLVNDSGDAGIDFNSSDMQLRYRSASDKLQFYSYGTSSNVMTIQKSNGYVGIGVTSPYERLYVQCEDATSPGIVSNPSQTNGAVAYAIGYGDANKDYLNTWGMAYSSGANVWGYGVKPSTTADEQFISSADNANFTRAALYMDNELKFFNRSALTTTIDTAVSMNERFRIDSSGNVKVGSGSVSLSYASHGMEIAGSGNQSLRLEADGSTVFEIAARTGDVLLYNNGTARSIRFGVGGGEKFRINSDGNTYVYETLIINTNNESLLQRDTGGTVRNLVKIDSGNSVLLGDNSLSGQVHMYPSTYTQINTNNGYLQIGPQNGSHCHYTTDRTNHWFNTRVVIDGGYLDSYNENLTLRRASSDNDRIVIEADQHSHYVNGNKRLEVKNDGILAQGTSRTTSYFQANNNGILLRLYKSSWTNATSHDIIYNAYGTNLGDYCYFKSAGNSTNTHGMLINSDKYLFWGRDNLTTGAIDNSATAPMTDVCMRVDENGNALFDGDVVAYSTTIASDKRLKENIKDLNYGLKDVLDIRPVSFDWIDKRDGQHDIGVIAQEIEKIIPEVVVEVDTLNNEDTHKTVDYAKLTSVLIKAVQEQQQQINELKEKLNV
jgi:hypothetical protein